jgi:hypothetical protein
MTDMVERVARAIVDTWAAGAVGVEGGGWDAQDDFGKDAARKCTRAAIAAMREPTGAMYMAGGIVSPSAHLADKDYKPYGTRTIGDMAAKAAWEKMIDAALEEKK